MKVKFQCKDMDSAGALHNAFLDCLEVPPGMEVDVQITFGGGDGLMKGYGVTVSQAPKEKAPSSEEAHPGGD
ncbi:MAG: hypothetical protein DRQ35_04840 [Gammaproteobacteria bacterium]|nr:MAG: hypothetical protein DRQ35_04840 [Gammaproteobacteria bacterium]